jgi:hypothetical protein
MTLQDPGERPSLVRSGSAKVSVHKLVKIRFLIITEIEQAYNVRVVSIVPSAETKPSISLDHWCVEIDGRDSPRY